MTFETLITFLTIENNNLKIHGDPRIKSDRDSIRNSCDVSVLGLYSGEMGDFISFLIFQKE